MSIKSNIRRVARMLLRRQPKPLPPYSPWPKVLGPYTSLRDAANSQGSGPRVLIATSLGGYVLGSLVESTLAASLTLRGAQVDVLLCNSFLPACQLTEPQNFPAAAMENQSERQAGNERPQPRCKTCEPTGRHIYSALGLSQLWFGEHVTEAQKQIAKETAATLPLAKIAEYKYDDLAVGEHALAGALRYFARGTIDNVPHSEAVLRRYLEASLLSVFAIDGVLAKQRYEVACFHHGIYVPQGLLGEVCRRRGVRVVNWNPAYRKQCFVFSHHETYHHTMISEPVEDWENLQWTPTAEKATLDYLKSRWQGTQDWIWFHEKPEEDIDRIAAEIGIDFSKPCIGLLTNVMWDAQLHYSSNAFPNMREWVLESIAYFAKRPDLQLLIRVHPAEVRGAIPSQQPLVAEIEKAYPKLPSNVILIPPESRVSTYAAMEKCNAVIIYNTKTGIELASLGIPVFVAGEAWIRNKGFSYDASTRDEYFRLLDSLPMPMRMDGQATERARKYAFHFFFRRMIPLPFIDAVERSYQLTVSDLEQLKPGNSKGLDVICDGILHGSPFIYPAEVELSANATPNPTRDSENLISIE